MPGQAALKSTLRRLPAPWSALPAFPALFHPPAPAPLYARLSRVYFDGRRTAMPTLTDSLILAEKVKAVLREFNPEASESEVLDAVDALIALLPEEEEDDAA